MKSILVDWSEFEDDGVLEEWEFTGRTLLEEKYGRWSEYNEDGIDEDTGFPLMNYAYPTGNQTISDKKILRVCEETNCTVVFNNNDNEYYLALTAGGMDLSQDIALAYMIINTFENEKYGFIDKDMLDDIYISGRLSIGENQYKIMLETLKKQYQKSITRSKETIETINKQLKGV